MSPQEPAEGDRVTVDPTMADEEVLPAPPEPQYPQERKREEQGNRGPEEEPGFGQGA